MLRIFPRSRISSLGVAANACRWSLKANLGLKEASRFRKQLHVSACSGSFVKDLFVGKFNNEKVIPFPEALNEEQKDILDSLVEPVDRFFYEKVDNQQMDRDATIPAEVMSGLKELGLFGLQIPLDYGGLGLSNTNYARVVESFSVNASIATTLMAHQSIGLKGILICGTDEQKQKYLPSLATGEHMAAFALTEPTSGSDAASIRTRASLSSDGKHFLLNGGKIWITNGGWADVFTVFAKTEVTNDKGEKQDKVTAFIVERAFGGISNGKPEDKLGIRASNTCEVHFDNTPVPVENVLGEVGGGFKVAMNILNSGRFGMGAAAAGGLRKLMGQATEHAVSRKQFGKTLSEFGQIQGKFAKMSLLQYACESMAYLTTALIDNGDDDCSVEAAICKIYGSEGIWDGVNEALQTLGGLGYMKEYPYEGIMRDVRIMMIYEGTNEILRMYIALTGMQYAGKELQKLAKSLKNPFANPGALVSFLTSQVKHKLGIARVDVDGLDPHFQDSAKKLGENVASFGMASQMLLRKYGKNIMHEQLLLKRMADVVIEMYAMTAVLSRASRTIQKGNAHAEDEILMANRYCQGAYAKNKNLLREVFLGTAKNGDADVQKIADRVFKTGGQITNHPLSM